MRPLNAILPQLEGRAAKRRRRLNLFRPPYRRYVTGLTSTSPAIEDLADSFPALLFAMATGYGTVAGREAGFRAVVDGQSLKEAAGLLGLPMWTRRIPAGALTSSLPPLPSDDAFALEMINRIPQAASECEAWLDRVFTGLRLIGRDMAVWIARETRLMPPLTSEEMFQWLLAWAWASSHSECRGRRLMSSPWSLEMGLKRAMDEVAIWRKRIDLVGALADPGRDPWYPDAKVGGFDIVQLLTVEDFVSESGLMENCLDQYAAHLAYGRVRIFSVRRDGKPVADIELTVRSETGSEASLSQVRGPHNRRAPPAVWQAVTSWLDGQQKRALKTTATVPAMARAELDRFWRPYIMAIDVAGLTLRLPTAMVTRDRLWPEPRVARVVLPRPVVETEPTLVQRMARAAGRGR